MVIMDEIGDQVLQTQTLIYIPVSPKGVILFVLLFEELGLGNFEQKNCYICQVTSSLTAAKAAREHAISGAYHATADAARKARGLAEAAFFQPSIMSLLYFPAEHQLAIYTVHP
jgi:hypothetical protein